MASHARSMSGRVTTLKGKVVPAILAALAVSILIYVLYYINFDILYGRGASAILFAAFGSSAFILFMSPRSKSARAGAFVKSYIIGAVIGAIGFYSLAVMPLYVVAGIALFAVSMLMYLTDSMHPPAIGIAIAFILYRISGAYGIFIVLLGIALLLILRFLLEVFVYDIEKGVVNKLKRRGRRYPSR